MMKTICPLVDGVMLEGAPLEASNYVRRWLESIAMHPLIIGTHLVTACALNAQEAYNMAKTKAVWAIAHAQPYITKPMGLKRGFNQNVVNALPDLEKASNQINPEDLKHFTISGTPDDCAERILAYRKSEYDILSLEAPSGITRETYLQQMIKPILEKIL